MIKPKHMATISTTIHDSITRQQYKKAFRFLIGKIKQEMPSYLTYHNVYHTLYVIKSAEQLMKGEGVPEEDQYLILTAALFHDAGYLQDCKNHEELSCNLAKEFLPSFGYSNKNIEEICRLVMVTKMPQSPTSLYEKILCDADLYNLGGNDFFTQSENLYKEFRHCGFVHDEDEWNEQQIKFLGHHHYFTKTALAEREPEKKKHIRQLQTMRRA